MRDYPRRMSRGATSWGNRLCHALRTTFVLWPPCTKWNRSASLAAESSEALLAKMSAIRCALAASAESLAHQSPAERSATSCQAL
eukprot:scaffold52186_cov29-Tisochrysis_lutea.AAC.9